jgi:hypothetical protein
MLRGWSRAGGRHTQQYEEGVWPLSNTSKVSLTSNASTSSKSSHFHGNRTHAAKLLGISIRGLRIKLRGYERAGVQVPPVHNNSDEEGYFFGLPSLGSLPLDG